MESKVFGGVVAVIIAMAVIFIASRQRPNKNRNDSDK